LIQARAARRAIVINYIEPGNPQQNAYIKRFNQTVRYESAIAILLAEFRRNANVRHEMNVDL